MAVLERVMQMKQQGQTESQIINNLQREGISPREINEALSQSQIKSMVGTENFQNQESQAMNQQMQPSMSMQQDYQDTNQIPSQYQPATAPYAEQYSEAQGYGQEYQQYSYGGDVETINEIAQQIVDEKTQNILKQTATFNKFKDSVVLEIDKINSRLEKIENTLAELQISIIRKVGEYGENIENISKEMQSTQDSFSKILNPLTDTIREFQKVTGKEDHKSKKR
ncbi:MAG: hypothetical protein WC438_02080 [Candidatus Pacearchaeota archaeon]